MIKELRMLIRGIIEEALDARTIRPKVDPHGEFDPIEIPGGVSALRYGNKGLDSLIKRANDANDKFLATWDRHGRDEEEIKKKRKRSEELLAQLGKQDDGWGAKNVDMNAQTVAPGKK